MRLVMGGEALLGPLTGIGRYTWQLSRELLTSGELQELQFLAHGRLMSAEAMAELVQAAERGGDGELAGRDSLFNRVRSRAAQNAALVRVYQAVFPLLERFTLRHFGADDLLHSPNYLLPPFRGRRVVSILDLSTLHYPQFHPAARVSLLNSHIERATREADHILTISDQVRGEIIEAFDVAPERVSTTYLAADPQFLPRSRADFERAVDGLELGIDYKSYFLFISTIEPRKNLERLLDAYEAYAGAAGSAALPLLVTGMPGWNSDHIHHRLQALQASGAVRYLGFLQQAHVPTLMAGARALLYPSLYEGFGLPILEAMQSGTAVLTSRDSAMSEVAGDAALLVDPQSTDEISGGIARLAHEPELTQQLEQAGRIRAGAFTWSACARQTLDAYRSCLG